MTFRLPPGGPAFSTDDLFRLLFHAFPDYKVQLHYRRARPYVGIYLEQNIGLTLYVEDTEIRVEDWLPGQNRHPYLLPIRAVWHVLRTIFYLIIGQNPPPFRPTAAAKADLLERHYNWPLRKDAYQRIADMLAAHFR